MSVFDAYAEYYDLLYRDKDYAGEASYVLDLMRSMAPSAGSVLELGCGTGGHAHELARHGLEVVGVDLSERMLERARAREPGSAAGKLEFLQGDVRALRLARQFDCVLALFHVASYQTSNEDVEALLRTAAAHLKPGGAFIFDFWYGPAVLTQQPSVRVRRLENDAIRATRIAEPIVHTEQNVVDVNYEVLVEPRVGERLQRVTETHRMRYFFIPELHYMLTCCGFVPKLEQGWLGAKLGSDCWAAVMCAGLGTG